MKIRISRKLLFFIFWLALALLAAFFHADHFLNGDEGVTLNGAWNLYNGRRLYVDFFSFLPPLSFFLLLFVWKIVGLGFWPAKIFSLLLLFSGAAGLYKIAGLLRKGLINLFVPLFFILISSWWWIINHNVYQLIFSIWSVYFLLAYLKNDRRLYLVFSALLSSAAIATLQQKGLLLAFASFLILLFFGSQGFKQNWRSALLYVAGVSLPLLSLLFFWPFAVLWNSLVVFPLFNYVEANRISYYLLVLASAAWLLIVFVLRSRNRLRSALLILSGFFIISCYPLPDYYHLSLALALLTPLLPDLFIFGGTILDKAFRCLVLGGLSWLWLWPLSVFFAFLFFNFSFSRDYYFLDYVRKECPGKYLHVGPFLPNVYLETGKISTTAFDILITGHQTPAQFAAAAAQLADNPPACAVIANPESLSRFRHKTDNPVDNFIRVNYRLVLNDGPVSVWRRQDD